MKQIGNIEEKEHHLNVAENNDQINVITQKQYLVKKRENLPGSEMEDLVSTIDKFCSLIYDYLVLSENKDETIQINTNFQNIAA